MTTQDAIEVQGAVIQILPDLRFRVELENGHEVLTTLADSNSGLPRCERIPATLRMGSKCTR